MFGKKNSSKWVSSMFNSVWMISSSIAKTKFVSNENIDMKKDILIYNAYNENAIKTKIMYAKKYFKNQLSYTLDISQLCYNQSFLWESDYFNVTNLSI